jgi:hypothetical protein
VHREVNAGKGLQAAKEGVDHWSTKKCETLLNIRNIGCKQYAIENDCACQGGFT